MARGRRKHGLGHSRAVFADLGGLSVDPEIVTTQNLLIGAVHTIDASAEGSGVYAATGLPRGASINASTGAITYNAMLPEPPTQVVVTRGGVQVQNFTLTPLYDLSNASSYTDVATKSPHLDGILAAGLLNTDVSVANEAAMGTAIQTAYADKGSATAPKYHMIRYTGGNFAHYHTIARYDATAAETDAEHTFIIIDFQGASLGAFRYSHRYANLTIANATLTGDPDTLGSRTGVIYTHFGHVHFWKCKIGGYFDRVEPSRLWEDWTAANAEPLLAHNDVSMSFCHIAGKLRGPMVSAMDNDVLMVGCVISHVGEDVNRSFGLNNGFVANIQRIGCVMTRAVMTGPLANVHTDIDQTGTHAGSGWTIKRKVVGEVASWSHSLYGMTGFRYQDEGTTGTYDILYKDVVYAVSGYHAASGNVEGITLDGFVAAPAPGTGSFGPLVMEMHVNNPISGAIAAEVAAHATDSVAYGYTEVGTEVAFPNMSGEMKDRHWIRLTGPDVFYNPRNRYVPDELTSGLHPANIRNEAAFVFEPAAGWGGAAGQSPADAFLFPGQWGAPPVNTNPTIAFGSLTSTELTVTPAQAGWVYYTIDSAPAVPTATDIMQGTAANGTFTGNGDNGEERGTIAAWGRFWQDGTGAKVYDLTDAYLPDVAGFAGGVHPQLTSLPDGTYYANCVVEDDNGGFVSPVEQSAAIVISSGPAFVGRGATFDGTDHLYSGSLSFSGGADGMLSVWMRNSNAVWSTPQSHIFEVRTGGSIRMTLRASGSGVMTLRLDTDLGPQYYNIFAGDGSTALVIDQWYHIMAEWVGGGNIRIYVDGTLDGTYSIGTPLWDGETITAASIGTDFGAGAKWDGDLAHVWFDPNQRLDLSVAGNREKFLLAGDPVDLGSDGSTPTGTAPAFYFDGDADADPNEWLNQGTGGSVPLTGTIAASGVPSV